VHRLGLVGDVAFDPTVSGSPRSALGLVHDDRDLTRVGS
jgi:hypothetical protein